MTTVTDAVRLSPKELAERARSIADRPEEWIHRVRLSADGRWYTRLHADTDHEIWLISWLPGQSTGLHDHGGSCGAFAIALGELAEHRTDHVRTVAAGQVRSFGPEYVHDVQNQSHAPAVSVHAYSPPLTQMRRFDLDDEGRLVPLVTERVEDW
jgi:predicted metal-dependent enzyme (double-stranded beta helix superfamily)